MGAAPWKTKVRRRRSSHAAESSSEQGASEADIDSDSGYCSPKHCQAAAICSRHADCTASATSVSRNINRFSYAVHVIANLEFECCLCAARSSS